MKGIIFDFNGTMFQDSHLHEEAWVYMVNKYSNGSLREEDILLNLHGRTNKEILNFFISDSLSDEEINKLSFEKEAYYRASQKLNLKPENCLVVEDAYSGILAAQKAHIGKIIAIDPFGKNFDLFSKNNMCKDGLIKDFTHFFEVANEFQEKAVC